MSMYVGVDLVKIERWQRILDKFPARAEKIFTAEEIAHCEKKGKKRAESYAALWGDGEGSGYWDFRLRLAGCLCDLDEVGRPHSPYPGHLPKEGGGTGHPGYVHFYFP